jgi:hypothetical protein
MVGGLTVVWQKATFFGMLEEVHAIHNIPSVRPDPMQAVYKELIRLASWNSLAAQDAEIQELSS